MPDWLSRSVVEHVTPDLRVVIKPHTGGRIYVIKKKKIKPSFFFLNSYLFPSQKVPSLNVFLLLFSIAFPQRVASRGQDHVFICQQGLGPQHLLTPKKYLLNAIPSVKQAQ